ncbi:MAG TPA: hypothetical protein VMT03_07595 [Polyangia bacterium]|nr:hypothetical protein [Polyangia bacterium]
MARTTRTLIAFALGALGAGLGCSGASTISLGNNPDSGGGQASALAGTWTGYAEAHTFQPSGSDQVRFVLDASGNGTVQVGTDALLPAPTDPNLGYPPGTGGQKPDVPDGLVGGVLYPVYAPQLQAEGVPGRIQFGLKDLDYYAAWCALHPPVYGIVGCSYTLGGAGGFGGQSDAGIINITYGYSISSFNGGESSTRDSSGNPICYLGTLSADCMSSTDQQVDCGLYDLTIAQVCACTAASCTSRPTIAAGTPPSGYPLEFDGTVDSASKTLTGTLAGYTVHLTRQ